MMKTLTDRPREMLSLHGTGVSSGLARGRAFVYMDVLQMDADLSEVAAELIPREQLRLETAIADVRRSLIIDADRTEARLGRRSADIFLAQEAVLLDPLLVKELKKTLEAERLTAEQVVRTVFRLLARRFRDMQSISLRGRGDDIDDLSRRLLLSLAGIHASSLEHLPPDTVLVARRLLPSDTVFLSRLSTVAVLAEFAGPAAHAALLAREMGIPCVGGIPDLMETVRTGDVVLVDGAKGEATLNPDPATLKKFERALFDAGRGEAAVAFGGRIEPTQTPDGARVFVMANVRSREDVEVAVKHGADGIGLFRTEPFFLSAKHFPSDKGFAEFLLHSLDPARGSDVTVRLLDIGADKTPLYLHLPPEIDPSLGRRGVRVLLEYSDILDEQLRALLEVSRHFAISILIPMVTTERDITFVKDRLRELATEMNIREIPRVGAMIETPAAALSVPSLKRHADFFSIGSNDLTQYVMAAGRENPLVTQYFLDDHPSVLRLIKLAIEEAGETPISLCGELAGRADAMPSVLKTGMRTLSVAPSLVPSVRRAIRGSCSG